MPPDQPPADSAPLDLSTPIDGWEDAGFEGQPGEIAENITIW